MQVCWDKCMGTPGRTLSSREQACLSDCARRFLDTTQVRFTTRRQSMSSFKRVCVLDHTTHVLTHIQVALHSHTGVQTWLCTQLMYQKFAQKSAAGAAGGGSRF